MKEIVFLIMTFIGVFSCSAQVELNKNKGSGGPPSPNELMRKMDKNQDGKLSKSEARGPITKDFDRIDKDGDGFLTIEELASAAPPPRRK